jgi:hypothetical protein
LDEDNTIRFDGSEATPIIHAWGVVTISGNTVTCTLTWPSGRQEVQTVVADDDRWEIKFLGRKPAGTYQLVCCAPGEGCANEAIEVPGSVAAAE